MCISKSFKKFQIDTFSRFRMVEKKQEGKYFAPPDKIELTLPLPSFLVPTPFTKGGGGGIEMPPPPPSYLKNSCPYEREIWHGIGDNFESLRNIKVVYILFRDRLLFIGITGSGKFNWNFSRFSWPVHKTFKKFKARISYHNFFKTHHSQIQTFSHSMIFSDFISDHFQQQNCVLEWSWYIPNISEIKVLKMELIN